LDLFLGEYASRVYSGRNNQCRDRKRDFTYLVQINRTQKATYLLKSAAFIRLLKELQPYIDSNFNTSTSKTIIGQSLGGFGDRNLKNPELFDNYIIVSPSLWWDNESLLKVEPKSYSAKKSIYIAVGKEGDDDGTHC
jgi:predicted alpha/beta superfamily hydrolase